MSISTRNTNSHPSLQHIDCGGEGPTFLLLHGVTRCGKDWESLLPALTAAWRVITLDQRGHGGSERAGSYLVNEYVDDFLRWMHDELAKPLIIFGHSLGAMVAAAVAAELPQLVLGIVLEDPPFHTMGNRIAGSAWQTHFIGMREAARRGGTVLAITDALADIQIPVNGGGFKRLGELRSRSSLNWSAQCLRQLDPEVLTPVIEGRWLDGDDDSNTLSGIRCPTLLLQGDPTAGGALTDADAASAIAELSSCQHVRFTGCGHQLHRDRPQEVLQALWQFTAFQNSNNSSVRDHS
ncbi:MAG: alpha/beta hydrolase [Planctomycetota bacterium]|nr:alpha/beta hydrolase [Planctomycetota bacterium]